MNSGAIHFLFVLFLSMTFSCKSNYREQAPPVNSEMIQATSKLQKRIPPGTCRIQGTLIAIKSDLMSDDPSDPCSKTPCNGIVRIDSILGYGQGFSEPISTGKELPVTFKFTFQPSKEQFPDMSGSYPGLQAGDSFVADVAAQHARFNSQQSVEYLVYGYDKKQ